MLAPFLGLPRQSEILIIIFLGICFLSLDFSLFEIKTNLEEIWKLELTKTKNLETVVKYIISAVVLARTFTLHAFLACYIVMLWPAIFEEKPNLMLPWLLLGIIRCLILNAITFVVGTFLCQKEKGLSPICLEYILAQIIDHGPSVYAWITVLNFYRELVGERHSNQSSEESLLSGSEEQIKNQDSDGTKESENSTDKSKSYSLSDLNLDYMHSSRFKRLSADLPIEVLLEELKHLVSKTKILNVPSKSFDSIKQDKSDTMEIFETFSEKDLSIMERTMRILDVSEDDVSKAKEDKNKLIQILKEVNIEDVNKINQRYLKKITSPSFYVRHGNIRKGFKSYVPKSLSLHDERKSHNSCLCYLRRKLQKDQDNSKLTLVESEIANIEFDETVKDNDTTNDKEETQSTCRANFKPEPSEAKCKKIDENLIKNFIKNDIPNNLNSYGVVVGATLGFNTNIFVHNFVLKKNISKNLGCKICRLKHSFFMESRNGLGKKLAFLRNLSLL